MLTTLRRWQGAAKTFSGRGGLSFATNPAGNLRFPSGRNVRVFVVGMGQSLGAGSRGVPARSISPMSPKVQMLDIGLNSDVRVGNPASYPASLVRPIDPSRIVGFMPAVARASAMSPKYGETGLNRLCNAIFETVSTELNFEPTICMWTIAQGGAGYQDIKRGTTVWQNGLAILRRATELSRREGRPPFLPFIMWRHGESDQKDVNYLQHLLELYDEIQSDYLPILGQQTPIAVMLIQSSSFMSPSAALAMLEAAERHPDKFFLSHPSYPLEHSNDHVHLTSRGYVQDGDYAWRAARAHLSPAGWGGFRPVRERIVRRGSVVQIPMLTPSPPIVIDRGLLGVHAGTTEGFTAVRAANGAPIPILAVELINGDTVSLTLEEDPGERVRIDYALSGHPPLAPRTVDCRPRGSIADSATPRNFALHFSAITPE